VISRIVNSAAVLAKKIKPDKERYVLCHSDIHAGNVLIAKDESLYIVDWDDPMFAPKEKDLMFIGGGIGNVWNHPDEIDYFYEGYGDINLDLNMLSYYRFERIVEDIALFGQDLLAKDHDDASRLQMFQHFKAMFTPKGVIEMAFSSSLLGEDNK